MEDKEYLEFKSTITENLYILWFEKQKKALNLLLVVTIIFLVLTAILMAGGVYHTWPFSIALLIFWLLGVLANKKNRNFYLKSKNVGMVCEVKVFEDHVFISEASSYSKSTLNYEWTDFLMYAEYKDCVSLQTKFNTVFLFSKEQVNNEKALALIKYQIEQANKKKK